MEPVPSTTNPSIYPSFSMGKPALARIRSIAEELQSLRKIPKRYHVDLENRCILIWGKPRDNPDGTYGARERKAASREKQAQATYSDVQDENCHMLLPFMLAMSLRACEGFVEMQEIIAEHSTFRLSLGIESKELLERMAAKNEFNKNPDYIAFIESLFPARVSDPPFSQETESLGDFELIQRIIKQRGLSGNRTCVQFLNFMFPDKHQLLNECLPNNHLTVHAGMAGSPKRKRAPTDNVYPEYTPDATDSPGSERSNAIKRGPQQPSRRKHRREVHPSSERRHRSQTPSPNKPQESDVSLLNDMRPTQEVTVELRGADLFRYLGQKYGTSGTVKIKCPFSGKPLPSVEIQSEPSKELYVKMEFSIELCEAIVEHVRVAGDNEVNEH
ncbi:hypothetical protein ACLOAV_006432 [Pseudogymnoascus australis]